MTILKGVFIIKFSKQAFKNFFLILSIIVFISGYNFIFGSENSLIGVGIITALLFFKDIDLGVKRKDGTITVFIFLIISVVIPAFSAIHPFIGLFINFFAIYYITILTSEKVDYKAYIAFILLYVLAEGNPVTGDALFLRILSIVLFATIIMIIYYVQHRNDTDYKTLLSVTQEAHIKNFSFALKLAFSLSFAMFLSSHFHIHKHMWFTITVMSLTQIDLDVTFSRMKHRIFYTVIGSAIYIVVFGLILPDSMIIYITLIMSYIYTFIKRYEIQMIFITISSLIANQIFFASNFQAILSRIILIIFGIFFTYAITKIDFEKIYKKIKRCTD